MDKTGEDLIELHLGKFEKKRPTFFQIYIRLHGITSKCHLHGWKIVLSGYLALILQMEDSCPTNLTFRAPNFQN